MSVETRAPTDAATEAWTMMLQFFFSKGRPRMVELWREFDLKPPQQMLLSHLGEPQPMGELAQLLHCDNSNITGLVDRMEERGLVERRAAEGDRRVKLIALTEAGERLRTELDRRRAQPPPEFDKLSEAELRKLQAILTKLSH